MKPVLMLLLLTFSCMNATAQIELTIIIKDTKGKNLNNVEVTAKNQSTNSEVKGRTDANGRVALELTEVGVYSLSYLDQKNYDSFEVKEGIRGRTVRMTTYDPTGHFDPKEKPDRSNINFRNITSREYEDKPGTMRLTIRVVTRNKRPVSGVSVTIASLDKGFKMTGASDRSGDVIFHVPVNSSYEVDLDGIESLKTVTTPNTPNAGITHFIFYEKTDLQEIAKGDTLIQRNIRQTKGTNTHVLFTLTLLDYDNQPLEDEPVYLKAENGPRVYESETDKDGKCTFLLKKTDNYILNLKYEENLHLAEVKNAVGFGQESLTRRYRGSKEIERILAEQAAEMERQRRREERERERLAIMQLEEKERREALKKLERKLVDDFYAEKMKPTFNETPVREAQRPQNYKRATSNGFELEFKSSGPIGTPTIVGDNMCLPAGHYSTDFYCLDATSGDYKWGVELGESGASPAVHSNGVLLINTYSCTLYAIDVRTGRLLWSKWLAGTVYSTPSADEKSVFVVFRYGGAYVTCSFDLRSGNFNWINRVDSRVIACPVVEGNEVHVASQSGFYYIFDKETGKPLDVITTVDAVSSPTVTDKSIYLTAKVDGKDKLVEIDRSTKKIKEFSGEIKPKYVQMANGSVGHMNFNGSRPVVYKNKYVVMTDIDGIKVFDCQTEQILWKESVQVNMSQVPIVADDKIYLATKSGTVNIYDVASGSMESIKGKDAEIDAQPVFHKGFLFVVSAGVLSAIRSNKKFQWNQWNKDSRHNLNIE